jgi:arginyl-tRNA--protein-N-Asp/Glu arginylyltransferase
MEANLARTGKLMAVGVVDVLPRCLSSVYLFWDADFAHLAPGKLTALKEIEWVQQVRGCVKGGTWCAFQRCK